MTSPQLQDSGLPRYSSSPSVTAEHHPHGIRSEHTVSLENSKQRKWLSMFVKSRSLSSASPPLFFEGDVITGRVELDLEKSETIKGVVISLKAGTTSVGQEEELFVSIDQELWTPSMALPGQQSPPSTSKLKGQFSWPFSITLPSEAALAEKKGAKKSFPLPPSFSERASPAYIDYRLEVTIKRPALKVNQSLSSSFGYMPLSRADTPSQLRQKAYKEGIDLIGPEGDPEGWMVLPPVHVKGTLFGTREVEVECSLAIATPFTYALGEPIPLAITLSSPDTEALDLLSTPSAIRLYLVRSVALGSEASIETAVRRSNNFFQGEAGRAAIWQTGEGDGKKILQGEIEVKRALRPTFIFPRFTVRYTVDLLSFEAPGFVQATHSTNELLSAKVTITAVPAPGITARSYAPPGYVHPQGGDYNKAMGLLENGNQRFYHHGGTGGGLG